MKDDINRLMNDFDSMVSSVLDDVFQRRERKLGKEEPPREPDRLDSAEPERERWRKELGAVVRRADARAASEVQDAKADSVRHLLEPILNLTRGLKTLPREGVHPDFVRGLQMIESQFVDALSRLDVQVLPAWPGRFNPNEHEAVGTVHTMNPAEDGYIVTELSPTYRMGARVLRPAQVVVALYKP